MKHHVVLDCVRTTPNCKLPGVITKPWTRWGQVAHICVNKLFMIGSDNGWMPGQCVAIICTNAEILLIRSLGTNFNEILSEIHTFSFKEMHLKMPSGKWWLFCLAHNVLSRNTYYENNIWEMYLRVLPRDLTSLDSRYECQWSCMPVYAIGCQKFHVNDL